MRGAYVAIATPLPDERARGVITYSSGNHAQGVARAARLLGAPAVVVMPSDAPAIKRDRVAADGAEIVVVGTASDERQARAEAIAAERGLAIIPPYDDDRIIAGQGTVGLEIVEDLPDVADRPRPDRRRRTGRGRRDRDQGAPPACARHRRGAGAGRGRPRIAGARRDRPLVRGRRLADHRRRDADPGARPSDVRAPAGPPRRDRDRQRGRDRRRRPARRRTVAPRRRAVGRPGRRGDRAIRCRELGLAGHPGPVVGVVSGGNVDPDAYRAYLEAPLPD